MELVDTDRSEARLSLLQLLGDGQYDKIGTFWNDLLLDWDGGEHPYDAIRKGVEQYQAHTSKTATEETEAILFDQLREVLAYDSEKLQLKSKKIEVLCAIIRDFEMHNKKAIKSAITIKRLENASLIVRAMCQCYPSIAFEPCPDNTKKGAVRQSAFESAVPSGSGHMLQIILDVLLASLERYNITDSEPTSQDHQSQEVNLDDKALAEKNVMEVVELLLNTFASLSRHLQDKAMNILNVMVSKNASLFDESTWKTAVTTPSPDLVRLLLEAENSKFLTESHAAFVVEKGTVQMWNAFPQQSRRNFISKPNCDFLHKAVSLGKVDMVEALLELEPALIEVMVGEVGYGYPLQHLQKFKETHGVDEEGKTYNAIRDLLVHAMIRSHNLGLQKIREILKQSNVEANEMSFHFPQFKSDSANESCADYVRGLQTMKVEFFRYERLLKYAIFPDLNGQVPFMGNEELKQDHNEVTDVFDWLSKRGVKEVMSLTVEDRLHCPHTDEDVASCVNKFRVRVLKWKKLDIYLTNLRKDAIEELHLWSSGNQSVHDQWLGQIPEFKQLKRLYVYVVKDILSPRRINEVSERLGQDLNDLHEKNGHPWISFYEETSVGRDVDFKSQPETQPQTQPRIKVSQIQWLQQRENIIYRSLDNISSDLVGPRLAEFIKNFSNYYRDKTETRKTKVALIDSGVVVVGGARGEHLEGNVASSDLAQRIVEGISLVSRDNEEQPWWHATEPHGTQMATLICSINPFCDLYVVKVAESNASGITGHNVAKAVDWARKKGVDIISLSLVAFSDTDREMANAIKKARDNDIVVTCSTADEGSIGAHSVGDTSDVLPIAACDKWGNLLPQSQKTGFKYQFIGHNVHVGQVPYLESAESIEGSSVSTAVAAGMASLILACARISSGFHSNDIDGGASWRFAMVTSIFHRMAEGGSWVVLEKLCGKGRLEKEYDFKKLVDEAFTDNDLSLDKDRPVS